MAVEHDNLARDAAVDAVLGLLGEGAKLRLRLAGTISAPGTIVSTLLFSTVPFADSSGGTAIANSIASDANATGNATAVGSGSFDTSGDTVIIYFQVAATGSDLDLTGGLTIAPGDIVSVTTPITYTMLAG